VLAKAIGHPLLRHNFCGAFFAFRKEAWRQIRQPDGSIGFWEDLLSYGEEIDFSSELQRAGYWILQLPFVFEHLHSQTFAAHPDLRLRMKLSPYLSFEKFKSIAAHYPGIFEVSDGMLRSNSWLSLLRRLSVFGESEGRVTRLNYSKAMLFEKWNDKTILGVDGPRYLKAILTDGFPMALQNAVEGGHFSLPDAIMVRTRDGQELRLSSDSCIDRNGSSLV
jgi:hypothetical protein